MEVVELGCGMGRKTQTFLEGVLQRSGGMITFVPIDVSSFYLSEVQKFYSTRLRTSNFCVKPYCGEYQAYLGEIATGKQMTS